MMKKINWKKAAAWLAFVVLTGSLMSCAAPPKSSPDVIEQPREVTIGYWKAEQLLNGDPLQQFIENKFNIRIVPVNLNETRWNEDLQKLAIRGELPDLFVNDALGTQLYYEWKERGVVQKISGNLDKYPYLKEYLDDPYLDKMKDEDGALYCIPRKGHEEEYQAGLMRCVLLRRDIMEEHSWPVPETYEEFKELLRVFSETCEDAVPLVTENANKLEALYLGMYPELCNLERGWVWEDERYIPAYYSSNMENGLACLQELYQEGLLDSEFPYRNAADAEELFLNGKSIAICIPLFKLVQDGKRIAPDFPIEDTVIVMRPWKLEDGSVYRFTTTKHWSEFYISRQVDAQKRDRILALLDYLLSEEFTDDIQKNGLQSSQSVNFFSDVINLGVTFQYRNTELYPDYYPEKLYEYMQGEIEWYHANTDIPDFNMDIPFLYSPLKEKLPGNQKIHDEIVKAVISPENVTVSWGKVREMLREEYHMDETIEEVNKQLYVP